MAKKTIVQLIDDIDGTVLEPGEGESIEFSIDGKSYSIDLTSKNAKALRSALKPYMDHASSSRSTRRSSRAKKTGGATRSAKELQDIRQWARDKGYTVASRGRIKSEILQAYDAAA